MTDVEKKVDMSLDELVAMRQKEAKKKARGGVLCYPRDPATHPSPSYAINATLPLTRSPSAGQEARQESDGPWRR
jgi:hypothetical protein